MLLAMRPLCDQSVTCGPNRFGPGGWGRAEGEARGRVEEARKILIRHGTKKFGPPDEQVKARIAALADLDRLHDLVDRVLDVASWDELLGASKP